MNQSNQSRWSGMNLALFALNLVLVLFLILRFSVNWGGPHGPVPGDKSAMLHPVDARGKLYDDEQVNISIFEQNSPCTVNVTTYANVTDPSSFDILKVPQGTGTGFLWSTWKQNGTDYGIVVTNHHVIADIDPMSIRVTLADQSTWKVVDVNSSKDRDLAVLWTDAPAERLKFIKVGDSSSLKVGQKVYAIGNPFGLDQTLTSGIISALNRELRESTKVSLRGLIQTDASINPGNSGGPLLDSAGRLIGVNTAIVSPSRASAGIGFAIPVDDVNHTVTSLIRKEVELRAVMGIHTFSDQVMENLGKKGVLIGSIVPDSPAAKAGLRGTIKNRDGIRMGDIIVGIDDTKVEKSKDLFNFLDKCKVGQEIHVHIKRDDKDMTFDVTLTGVSK